MHFYCTYSVCLIWFRETRSMQDVEYKKKSRESSSNSISHSCLVFSRWVAVDVQTNAMRYLSVVQACNLFCNCNYIPVSHSKDYNFAYLILYPVICSDRAFFFFLCLALFLYLCFSFISQCVQFNLDSGTLIACSAGFKTRFDVFRTLEVFVCDKSVSAGKIS